MSLRFAKQIIYIALFFIFWYLVVTGIYRLAIKPAPSCFDGVQNQGERGIDCGGPCALSCTPSYIKSIDEVESVTKFDPDQTHFSLLAHIENQNSAYAAKIFDYTFSLYDENGNVVASFPGTSFIYGSEIKYILLPNIPFPKSPFTKIGFAVQNPSWVPSDVFSGPPKLEAISVNTRTEGNKVVVSGQIVSNENVALPKATIIAIFRGKYGQDAAVSQTELDDLLPRVPQPFSIIHPLVLNFDPAATKVFYYAAMP